MLMTNQELASVLAKRLDWTQKQTSDTLDTLVKLMNAEFEGGNSIKIQGFGLFEPKKKNERISVNPITKQRFLIPPKITLAFKPGQTVKDNLKKLIADE